MWRFFLQFRGFRASFGDFCSCFGILTLPLLFLGYAYGVVFFAPSLYPMVASLVGFSCGLPSLVVPACVWGFFLRRRSCVFFLSSCWVRGRLLLSLFWCGFCASSWGACSFPRRVLRLVTLSGFRNLWLQLAGLPLQWTFVVGLAVSWYTTWFSTFCQRSFPLHCLPFAGSAPFWLQFAGLLLRWSLVVGLEVSLVRRLVLYLVPCSSSGACGLRGLPCSRFPWGFLTFLSPGACPSASLVA